MYSLAYFSCCILRLNRDDVRFSSTESLAKIYNNITFKLILTDC